MPRSRVLSRLVRLFLIPVLLAFPSANTTVAAPQRIYTYANGIQLPLAAPLPYYQVAARAVTMDSVPVLARNFSNIAGGTLPQADTINKHDRLTILNETNNTVLEQFSATSGFYAYNPDQAFGSSTGGTPPKADEAMRLACNFIQTHQDFIPTQVDLSIPGLGTTCDPASGFPGYKTSTEWLTSQDAKGTTPTPDVALRLQVTVPLILQAGQFPIPLAGPGGHISMIFFNPVATQSANAGATTLDGQTPGLQAVAMPAFGRSFTSKGEVITLDPPTVAGDLQKQLDAAFPGNKGITIPTPALEYYVTDASTPQGVIEPTLNFSGITVILADDQVVTLKDITVPDSAPGPGGLGPLVTITSPANGASYLLNKPVSLNGEISEGLAPYSYEWQTEDGAPLSSGNAAAAGALPAFNTVLPVPTSKGSDASLSVRLVVTDANGVTRNAEVSFTPPQLSFMPQVKNNTSSLAQTLFAGRPDVPAAPNVVHTFGVEYGSDYPPYGPGGPDLSGVPPDANGFSSALWGIGYSRVFNWFNSLAWEKDWRDRSLGGGDCSYGVDRAEFVYYSGHGNNGGIAVPSNTHDSGWFDGANARYSSARWVGFSSCLTLRAQWTDPTPAPITRWFNAFQGAHMLLGFNSVMADIAFGGPLIDNMRVPTFFGIEFPWAQRTIAGAWVQTAFNMNAGKPAYIYAWKTGVDPSLDKLPSTSTVSPPRPFPVEWYFWVWWDE